MNFSDNLRTLRERNGMTQEQFRRKFMTGITGGVAGILASVILYIVLMRFPFFAEGARGEILGESIFLVGIAASVFWIVYTGLLEAKYNVERYNADNAWDNSEEGKENGRRIGMYCGALMTAATAAYVGLSAATDGWGRFWWLFAVGGICCGVIAIVLNKRKD